MKLGCTFFTQRSRRDGREKQEQCSIWCQLAVTTHNFRLCDLMLPTLLRNKSWLSLVCAFDNSHPKFRSAKFGWKNKAALAMQKSKHDFYLQNPGCLQWPLPLTFIAFFVTPSKLGRRHRCQELHPYHIYLFIFWCQNVAICHFEA